MRRAVSTLARVAAVGLLLLSGVGCLPIPGADSGPAGRRSAAYADPDTWLFVAITTRPSLGQTLALRPHLEAFAGQPGWSAAVEAASTSSASGQPVNVERDLLPLVAGDAALAVSGTLLQPQVVGLMQSSDPQRLLTLMGTTPPTPVAPYRGATFFSLSEAGEGGGTRTATGAGAGTTTATGARPGAAPAAASGVAATYRSWLLLGMDRSSLERVVDRMEAGGRGGLADRPRFREAFQGLREDRLAVGYLDSSVLLADQVTRAILEDAENLVGLQAASGRLALSLSAVEAGLSAEARFLIEAPLEGRVMPAGDALAALRRLPAGTLAAVSGPGLPPEANLDRLDEALSAVLDALGPRAPRLTVRPSTWLPEAFAIGVGRGTLGTDRGQGVGVPLVSATLRVRGVASAAHDIASLEALFPPKSVQRIPFAGGILNQVVLEPGVPPLTYGLLADWAHVVLGEPGEGIAATPATSLLASERLAPLADVVRPNGYNLFVDVEGVRVLLEEVLPASERALYERQVRPFVAPLRALVSTWVDEADGSGFGETLLAISAP